MCYDICVMTYLGIQKCSIPALLTYFTPIQKIPKILPLARQNASFRALHIRPFLIRHLLTFPSSSAAVFLSSTLCCNYPNPVEISECAMLFLGCMLFLLPRMPFFSAPVLLTLEVFSFETSPYSNWS